MKNTKHTPTPWEYEDMGIQYQKGELVITAGLMVVAKLPRIERSINNAEFIVRAVNSHEELLESLKEVLAHSELPAGIIREKAVKAIARAEEK